MTLALYCGIRGFNQLANSGNEVAVRRYPGQGIMEGFTNNPGLTFGSFFLYIIGVFIMVMAIVIAIKCNPDSKALYVILAFFFSEIYLLQFLIRKYMFKEQGYCTAF